jgi:hypothetical protein
MAVALGISARDSRYISTNDCSECYDLLFWQIQMRKYPQAATIEIFLNSAAGIFFFLMSCWLLLRIYIHV